MFGTQALPFAMSRDEGPLGKVAEIRTDEVEETAEKVVKRLYGHPSCVGVVFPLAIIKPQKILEWLLGLLAHGYFLLGSIGVHGFTLSRAGGQVEIVPDR